MNHVNKITVELLRMLAKNNEHITVMLPIEVADIVEQKVEEISMRNVEVAVVLNYFASMLEV